MEPALIILAGIWQILYLAVGSLAFGILLAAAAYGLLAAYIKYCL